MDSLSIFMSKRKIPKNISSSFKKKSIKSHKEIENFISDAVIEKLDEDKIETYTDSDSLKSSFVQHEVVFNIHIPYEILNELCKIAETLNYDTEKYIIKILRDEIEGRHLKLCGGIKKVIK